MHKLKSNYIKLERTERLHNALYPIIGVTGSIGTGKSTAVDYLRRKGYPVVDADQLIKDIYSQKSTINYISEVVPHCIIDDKINFSLLREEFFNNENLKKKIEQYLYRKVPDAFQLACQKLDFSRFRIIIYDIPLLFENNLQSMFDLIILIYADPKIQLSRIIKRDKISPELAQKMINQQLGIEHKATLSQCVIKNNQEPQQLRDALDSLFAELLTAS